MFATRNFVVNMALCKGGGIVTGIKRGRRGGGNSDRYKEGGGGGE